MSHFLLILAKQSKTKSKERHAELLCATEEDNKKYLCGRQNVRIINHRFARKIMMAQKPGLAYHPDERSECRASCLILGDYSTPSMGTPGSAFAERMASAVFTWLTFGAGVSFLVKNC